MSLLEEITAVEDTYNIIQEYGHEFELIKQTEVIREDNKDKFGSIKKVDDTVLCTLKAFPIRFDPTEKERTNKGFSDKVVVIMFVSSKELADKSLTFDIIRDRIRLQGKQYKIEEGARKNGHIGSSFRSYIVGLVDASG